MKKLTWNHKRQRHPIVLYGEKRKYQKRKKEWFLRYQKHGRSSLVEPERHTTNRRHNNPSSTSDRAGAGHDPQSIVPLPKHPPESINGTANVSRPNDNYSPMQKSSIIPALNNTSVWGEAPYFDGSTPVTPITNTQLGAPQIAVSDSNLRAPFLSNFSTDLPLNFPSHQALKSNDTESYATTDSDLRAPYLSNLPADVPLGHLNFEALQTVSPLSTIIVPDLRAPYLSHLPVDVPITHSNVQNLQDSSPKLSNSRGSSLNAEYLAESPMDFSLDDVCPQLFAARPYTLQPLQDNSMNDMSTRGATDGRLGLPITELPPPMTSQH